MAAVLACSPRALLSHVSAAWLWGISIRGPKPLEVTCANWRRKRPGIEVHRWRDLADDDLTLLDCIPVTSVARTMLDCAATVPFWLLEKFLERSEELKLFDLAEVEDTIRRASHHPGVGPLLKAIDLYKPASFSRSTAERVLLSLIKQVELPQPRPNYVEEGFELDFYWPELRFAIELDFYETHGTRAAFERDPKRQEDLKLAGIEVVRITGRRLEREPGEVVERIGRLLAQRAAALG